MSTDFGFTEYECRIIKAQIDRRAKFRREFLKQKSDPFKHSTGHSYFVFDEAVQRFLSMKVTQLDHFQVTPGTITFGICAIIIPMSLYGYAIWTRRQKYLQEIKCGRLKYKDRTHKFQ